MNGVPNTDADDMFTMRPAPDCLEVRPRGAAHAHRAAVVRVDEEVEGVGRHLVERAAAGDAGVVDHDVEAPELVERVLDDDVGAVDDAVAVGDRQAAAGADLLGHLARPRPRIRACRGW